MRLPRLPRVAVRALAAACLLVFGGAARLGAQDGGSAPGSAAPGQVQQGTVPVPQPAAQVPGAAEAQSADVAAASQAGADASSGVFDLRGKRIHAIEFAGVEYAPADPLIGSLGVKAGDTIDPAKIRAATRTLFLTGLYRNISLRSVTEGDGSVTLIFTGNPRYFIGRVRIQGVPIERLTSQLEYATELQPGLPFNNAEVQNGVEGIRKTLEQNGYYQPVIRPSTEHIDDGRQVDVIYVIDIGPHAQVGQITLKGDPGMTTEDFVKKAKLQSVSKTLKVFKSKRRVTRDTVANGLSRLRQNYQKYERLEAVVSLEKAEYAAPRKQLDYTFGAYQGPVVTVEVDGIKLGKARQKKLLPIYEESAVDNDLLNEGAHNIREFLQRQGYFDAEVTPSITGAPETQTYAEDGTLIPPPSNTKQTVKFVAVKGKQYKVIAVNLAGNKYFDTENIKERMQVQKADLYVRNGRYSAALLAADVDSITSLYKANGFTKVKITSEETKGGEASKVGTITVNVAIEEGPQQKFGDVTVVGEAPERATDVHAIVTVEKGQPFTLSNVSSDRDNLLANYLSKGFDQAKVEVRQTVRTDDPTITDIKYIITEGEQVFVDRVLVSGVHHVKKKLINDQLLLEPGEPLNGSALVEMQRRFYDLAVFNEANVAIQNPTGQADRKNVLVQLTEARRWDVTYGAGFEAQLSTPQPNCRAQQSLGGSGCSQGGKAGASYRVSADVTRINLFGTDQSVTLHSTYGLLEKLATITYTTPRFLGHKNLSSQFSGGYSNVQNITTFKASTLQGLFRVTQKVPKADTFIYDFTYRRVAVDQNSLQVTANLIPLLSQPVRVAGPGFTWFHDTRNPSPLDAQKGRYLSFTEFLAKPFFGSGANFNKVDLSYSTYTTFGRRRKYTFARNTRFGVENSAGANPNAGTSGCLGVLLTTNASCDPVPLPERLYAGGASSHRGFGINQAGPRDLTTGFPVGGTTALINTFELRLPPPVLPYVGDAVSFVVFHDMGNVFLHPGDAFKSIGRFSQPNRDTCKQVTGFVTVGTCDFAYFSHAVGLGARYHTPVGPIRLDLSYNMNPPIYPIIDDYSKSVPNHQVGQAGHIQFFFSIGQSF